MTTVDLRAELEQISFEPEQLRRVFSAIPSGLVAVSALVADAPRGLVASTFTPVSLDPAIATICIDHGSSTWPLLREVQQIGLSVLADHHQPFARQLGGPAEHRFDRVPLQYGEHGAILIADAVATFECSIVDEIPIGDHNVVVLRLHVVSDSGSSRPLIFHRSDFAGVRSGPSRTDRRSRRSSSRRD